MSILRRTRRFWTVGLLGLALVAWAAPASANALDAAKAAGELGERWDGYLGVVKPNAAAEALASDINRKRMAHYAQIAAKNGATVEATAAIAGAKLVEGAPSGQYVMTSASSGWKRVP
ncbi:MAG TPA: YdbL family protein [Myxococcota bacterium]|nr:YdbL family protein [Myxococcota bacterium]